MGLELGNPFVLRCVQDNREFRKVLLGLQWIFRPLFGDVADVDQFRCVVQEAAQASQPHQILFVFQLKTQSNFKPCATELYFTEKKKHFVALSSYLAGDVIDVVAVQQLGRDGQRDILTPGVVVFLFVPQLE